jgi:hypothetical protein
MTHAAMTPPATRVTSQSRAEHPELSSGIATPEHAARTPLPGENLRDGEPKNENEPNTVYARRRDGNVFTRTFVLCSILALAVAVMDPKAAKEASSRLGAFVEKKIRGSPSIGGAPAPATESCASLARDGAFASLADPRWGETVGLFLDAAREANANHEEDFRVFPKPRSERSRDSATRRLGAPKGIALAVIVEKSEDSRPDGVAAEMTRAAFECDCVQTFDVATYVASLETLRRDANARDAEANVRGELQYAMSAFLAKCPRGVAVIAGAERLEPPLLAALMPAVSEGGRFARDGNDIRSDGASYVFIAALGADSGEGGPWRSSGEIAFGRSAKAKMADAWRAGGSGGETAAGLAEAFRRRIDFVVPFRESRGVA